MDAEHRHELKTNELADWLGHLPTFLHDNAKTIIGVILIIAAGVVYMYSRKTKASAALQEMAVATAQIDKLNMARMRTVQAHQAGDEVLDTMMTSADALKKAASDAKSPNVAALLLIKQGDALRADLHYNAEEVDFDIVKDRVEKARAAYNKALTTAEDNASLTAMAHMGLGLCAEEIGEYDKAREIYEAIVADAAYAGTVFPVQAQQRLDNMADNRVEFVFVEAPPEITVPEINIPGPTTPVPTKPEESVSTPVEEVTITPNVPTTEKKEPETPAETEGSADESGMN